MTQETALPPEAKTYLAALRAALADLSPDEREDLLEGVTESLLEVLDEGDSIRKRLGPPEAFAAELRRAAGLPPSRTATSRRPSWAAARAQAIALGREVTPDLEPIWWLARAYIAVAAIALAASTSWSSVNGAVPRIGTTKLGGVVLLLAAVLSVALGMLERRHIAPRKAALTVNIVLALALVPVAVHLVRHPRGSTVAAYYYFAPYVAPTPDLTFDGASVSNIYAYSRKGRLLHDVLLYTGSGQPLSIRPGDPDPTRRLLLTKRGRPIYNSFPIRFFDPGTHTVRHPGAGVANIYVPRVSSKVGRAAQVPSLRQGALTMVQTTTTVAP